MQYHLQGLTRPIELAGCDHLFPLLAGILGGWRIEPTRLRQRPAIVVRREEDGYRLESDWLDTPVLDRTPASALCSFVVDLVKAYLGDAGLMGLHCGAVELGARLVVFPSWYRAGKSTLCARLAAAGHRIFADDVLAIRPHDLMGLSLGIAPRLRRPLPARAGTLLRAFSAAHAGLRDRRYLYLALPGDRLAPFGTTAAIGAIVLLEREAAGRARLVEIERADALTRLIGQNFGCPASAEFVFRRLEAMVADVPCLALRYADLDGAASAIEEAFAGPGPGPCKRAARCGPLPGRFEGALPVPRRRPAAAGAYRRVEGVVAHAVDGALFLIDPRTDSIFRLDPLAAGVWDFLEEPTSVVEAADLLAQAFPAIGREHVRRDIAALFSTLAGGGLIERHRKRRVPLSAHSTVP